METITKIRRLRLVKGQSISAIARDLNLSRNTVKKYLNTTDLPSYQRQRAFSAPNRPLIPRQTGHRFQLKPATDST